MLKWPLRYSWAVFTWHSTILSYCNWRVVVHILLIPRCCSTSCMSRDSRFCPCHCEFLSGPQSGRRNWSLGYPPHCWCYLVRDDINLWPLGEVFHSNHEVLICSPTVQGGACREPLVSYQESIAAVEQFHWFIMPWLLVHGPQLAMQVSHC
jgi:hypothetical protein